MSSPNSLPFRCRGLTAKLLLGFLLVALLNRPGAGAEKSHVYKTAEEVLALIPAATPLRPGGQWNAAAIEQANSLMDATKDQPAVFTIAVEYLEKFGKGFRIKVPDADAKGPHPFRVRLWIYFNADQAPNLVSVAKGQTITVAGKLTKALLNKDGDTAWVNFDIREAMIGEQAALTSLAQASGQLSNADAIVGKWTWFKGGDRTNPAVLDVRKDGTFFNSATGHDGTWVASATEMGRPTFTFTWKQTKSVGKVRVSEDGKSLDCLFKAAPTSLAERIPASVLVQRECPFGRKG